MVEIIKIGIQCPKCKEKSELTITEDTLNALLFAWYNKSKKLE